MDVYIENDELWLILDYYQLGSIFDIVKLTEEPLQESEISCVCYSILYALDYIHTLNRVHRGVKATNILVNSIGQMKLTDSGKFYEAILINEILGLSSWINSETIQGESCDYSTDIWDLGVCVIEMREEMLKMYQSMPVKQEYSSGMQSPTDSLNNTICSKEMKNFVDLCLQPEPSHRPKASELLHHPFILKYKTDLPQIRRKFCQEKLEKLTEYKKSMITSLQEKTQSFASQKPHVECTGEENVVDESDMPNNTVDEIAQRLNNENTIEYTLESDNYLTFIDKTSFQLTDLPSHIELTNRSPICPPKNAGKEPLSNIKPRRNEESQDQDLDLTRKLDDISLTMQNHQINFEPEKKNVKVPPLKLKTSLPIYTGKMPTIESQYSSENTYTKSKGTREEMYKSGLSNGHLTNQTKSGKRKNYKATNESNFVVKHKISNTYMNTLMNDSIDTETTLNPISVYRRKSEISELHGPDTTRQMIVGLENYAGNIPRLYIHRELKENTVSTAVDSKIGSGSLKSLLQTPNTSDMKQSIILKVVRENLECSQPIRTKEFHSKVEYQTKLDESAEAEKFRLELEMQRELEEIRMKYKNKLKSLQKNTKGYQSIFQS